MGKQRKTSESLSWEEDRAAVLAWVKADQAGKDVSTPSYIPLAATDADGWRYRATVRESGGRLVVAAVSVQAPEGSEGNLSAKLRAVHPPAILDAAGDWEVERRNPDTARLKRELIAFAKEHASEIATEIGTDPEVVGADLERDLQDFQLMPSSFFPPDAVERMDERHSRRGPRLRKVEGRRFDRNHYARIACIRLIAGRTSYKPNVEIARLCAKSAGWEGTTAKQAGDWVRIAASDRYGFLSGMQQGSRAAEPTAALIEWAEEHAHKEPAAHAFLRQYGKGER